MRPPHPDAVALSLPVVTGDPSGIWLAAGCLRRVADDVAGSPPATSGPLPSGGWQGAAADAARADARLVAARVAGLADRLVRAAAVLEEYGHALDDAQASVGLAGRYAAALADLHLAGQVAAHRLRALAAEVGDGPVGPGGQTSGVGWGGTRVDADPRAAAWAGLEVVAGQRHRDEARGAATELVESLDGQEVDPWAVDRAGTLLDRWGRDPVFGAAVWAALSPEGTQRLLAAGTQGAGAGSSMAVGGAWRAGRRAAVLAGLGASLAVFVNPAYATHLDPATTSGIAAARQSWLVRTAAALPGWVAGWGGSRVPVAWLQGQLLAGMAAAGLSPGVAYATTVGVALAADPAPTWRGTDPVLALTEALRGDVVAARAWLLHPLDGPSSDRSDTGGGLVVDHLVAGRYLQLDPPVAAASMGALGRLVVEAGRDPTSADATLVAGAYLDAVGRTLVGGPRPDAFSRVLAPALDDLGFLLGGHADALTAVLDDSASPGTDRATLTVHDRLVRQGRTPGRWEVVLTDRATTAALLGALALGSQGAGESPSSAPVPALAQALGGMGRTLEDDLARAVAAGTGAEIDVAARRLGATTGFVLTTAGIALAGRAADTDAQHRALAGAVDLAIGKVSIPGATGKLATPLVRAAAERVVDAAWPTGVEAAQREASAAQLARRREDALVAARTLVSRAQPWTDAQSPARWALGAGAPRSPIVFWDAAGVPLPEDAMTTAQRRSFTDWRGDEGLTVYDVVPQAVRDGIDAGVQDGTATAAVSRT